MTAKKQKKILAMVKAVEKLNELHKEISDDIISFHFSPDYKLVNDTYEQVFLPSVHIADKNTFSELAELLGATSIKEEYLYNIARNQASFTADGISFMTLY